MLAYRILEETLKVNFQIPIKVQELFDYVL
eukprot:SAG11_NODE_31138_length_294_cov_1.051282_1_plen_29_part_10